jgi:hypothetical protein
LRCFEIESTAKIVEVIGLGDGVKALSQLGLIKATA